MESWPQDARNAIEVLSFSLVAALLCTVLLFVTRWADLKTSVRDALNACLVTAGLTLTTRTLFGDSFGSRKAASWFQDLLSLRGRVQMNAAVALFAMFFGLSLVLLLLRRHRPGPTLVTAAGLALMCALPLLAIP
jgi:hypothetical protein